MLLFLVNYEGLLYYYEYNLEKYCPLSIRYWFNQNYSLVYYTCIYAFFVFNFW